MSETTELAPEFDMGDRIRKALRVSGMEAQELALYLGVSRNTITNWVSGRTHPRISAIRDIATRTGVSVEWLLAGRVRTATEAHDSTGAQATRRYCSPADAVIAQFPRRPFGLQPVTAGPARAQRVAA